MVYNWYYNAASCVKARSREQSLERDRREIEFAAGTGSATPSRVSGCPTPSSGSGPQTANHSASENQSSDPEFGYRTKSERSTLPRGKHSDSGGEQWTVERSTLPRGKSDSDTGWGEPRSFSRGKSDSDWGERCTLPRDGKSRPEVVDWCPACTTSRVSFHSVRDSSSQPRSEKGSSELLSSSLPTPPPPPFQASQATLHTLPATKLFTNFHNYLTSIAEQISFISGISHLYCRAPAT